MKSRNAYIILAFVLGLSAAGTGAQQSDDVPYWTILRVDKANMRVGPSTSYPIDWVYTRQGLPMRVLRRNQGWRYVEDPDGIRGWIDATMLTRERGAIVIGTQDEPIELRAEPSANAQIRWLLEPGVVGRLGECDADWCELDVRGHKGWTRQSQLWGTGEP